MDLHDLLEVARPEIQAEVEKLVIPSVLMTPTGTVPTTPTQSYFLGHPFQPVGRDILWPTDRNSTPMLFLVQINFAEMPPLPGFPREGMLQWFCGTDDTFGLTFEGEEAGISGLHARWWSAEDLAEGSTKDPTSPTPVHPDWKEVLSPAETTGPVALNFLTIPSLPGWEDSTVETSEAYQEALEEEEITTPGGSHVGGYPDLVQGDPRSSHTNRSQTLLVELSSDDLFMWGDVGTAQLFGNPTEVAQGRLDSLWWDWACC